MWDEMNDGQKKVWLSEAKELLSLIGEGEPVAWGWLCEIDRGGFICNEPNEFGDVEPNYCRECSAELSHDAQLLYIRGRWFDLHPQAKEDDSDFMYFKGKIAKHPISDGEADDE